MTRINGLRGWAGIMRVLVPPEPVEEPENIVERRSRHQVQVPRVPGPFCESLRLGLSRDLSNQRFAQDFLSFFGQLLGFWEWWPGGESFDLSGVEPYKMTSTADIYSQIGTGAHFVHEFVASRTVASDSSVALDCILPKQVDRVFSEELT